MLFGSTVSDVSHANAMSLKARLGTWLPGLRSLWARVEPARRLPLLWALRFLWHGFRGSYVYCGTRLYFPRWDAMFYRLCQQDGTYEPEVTKVLKSQVQPGTVYIDVGANVGFMSAPVLAHCPAVEAWSCEPSENSYPYLIRSLVRSPFEARWTAYNVMVGASRGESAMSIADAYKGGWDSAIDTGRAGPTRTIPVFMTTLDTMWANASKPQVSCLKIDVEGFEPSVLQGAVQLIAAQHPAIVVEWNQGSLDAYGTAQAWLLEFASAHGYQVLAIYPHAKPQRVWDAKGLSKAMRETEMFLLTPV